MTITIKIDTGNAAFGESPEERDQEVARIMREWAGRIPEDGYSMNLYDYNGNRVGVITMRGK